MCGSVTNHLGLNQPHPLSQQDSYKSNFCMAFELDTDTIIHKSCTKLKLHNILADRARSIFNSNLQLTFQFLLQE